VEAVKNTNIATAGAEREEDERWKSEERCGEETNKQMVFSARSPSVRGDGRRMAVRGVKKPEGTCNLKLVACSSKLRSAKYKVNIKMIIHD
jgi:hypothetical protein